MSRQERQRVSSIWFGPRLERGVGSVHIMGPAIIWLVYLSVVMIGGSLLAPLLYYFVQWAAPHLSLLESLASHPFHRYVNRAMLALAVLGILPLRRLLGWHRWSQLGLPSPGGQLRNLGLGFAIGWASLGLVALIVVACQARVLDLDQRLGRMAWKIGAGLLSALIVPVLEEVMFRGALFGSLRTVLTWKKALVLSSAVYAFVHFFARPENPETVHWYSGLTILLRMLDGWTDPGQIIPGLFSLLLVGFILGVAYERTGTLYFSIGLHSGWIFWLRTYNTLTDAAADVKHPAVWGTAKIMDGWLTTFLLALLLIWLWRSRLLSTRAAADA